MLMPLGFFFMTSEKASMVSSSNSKPLFFSITLSVFFFLLFFSLSNGLPVPTISPSCTGGPVRPTTPLLSFLEDLQAAALKSFGPTNFDPKYYIDLPLNHTLNVTAEAFSKLRRLNGTIPAGELELFIANYTAAAGSDLLPYTPPDFAEVPEGFLPNVEKAEVRAWALKVHSLWRNLSRVVSQEVAKNPDLHTLLPLPVPMVVPGSRFREVYYWDSYWTIRGLLVSKMYETAKALVRNLISLVETYGFVLNGGRSYYTNRSQPPLLSSMIRVIYERTHDKKFLEECLPALLKEYNFWNSGYHHVTIEDAHGHNHSLNRYYAMWNKPRPESFVFDDATTSNIKNAAEKQSVFREISSTAESGWDFSSRWMRNSSDLTTLTTTAILPVDLNAFILKMELDISFLASAAGDELIAKRFHLASLNRDAAFRSIFWNSEKEQWLDYWLGHDTSSCQQVVHRWEASNQNQKAYASNFVPLWVKSFQYSDSFKHGDITDKVAKSLKKSGLVHAFGIATSLTNSGQQWDFPNGWAPLQHMLVEGLAKGGSEEAQSLAEDIATRWITTNYDTFNNIGLMVEKYDVQLCGAGGGGGEYTVQAGFGWTNGVSLAFLEEFGWAADKDIGCHTLKPIAN